METKSMHVFKFFWPWQDESEEAWLREMSQHGWHLSKPDLFGSYTFTAGEPRDDIYRLDYRGMFRKNPQDYFQLFQDAGWEYVGGSGGWQYFRRPAASSGTDVLFSDAESKAGEYRRLLIFLVIPLLALLDWLFYADLSRYPGMLVIFYILHVILGVMLIGVLIRMRRLKRL
jgi:hypothetical protein